MLPARITVSLCLLGLSSAAFAAPQEESGAADDPSSAARHRLHGAAPDVTWGEAREWDVDGDQRKDMIVLGTRGTGLVVGVVRAAQPTPEIITLPDAGCGAASDAHLRVDPPPTDRAPADPDAPAAARRAPDSRLSVAPPDCDAFHLYFDGARIAWWRR
jgi:hypothetical protein